MTGRNESIRAAPIDARAVERELASERQQKRLKRRDMRIGAGGALESDGLNRLVLGASADFGDARVTLELTALIDTLS